MKTPLLLLDFEFTGHHAVYLRHIIRYGLTKTEEPIRVLITRELFDRTSSMLSEPEKAAFLQRVEFLDDDRWWRAIRARVPHKNLACWLYFETLNFRRRRERIVLLYLETIFYGIALSPLPRFGFKGFMFRPTFYYRKQNMLGQGLRAKSIFMLKWISSCLCRLRPGIKGIFTLDPLAEEYARSNWKTEKFRCIPDPLGPEPGAPRPVGIEEKRPKASLHLLLAGSISPRKGLKETVDALEALEENDRRRIVLSVVGEPEKESADYVRSNLDRAHALGVHVKETLRYVDLDSSIEAADITLAPYRRFVGSSAIVIRAAHFGKPVISTHEGLLAYFVRTRQLGSAVDVGDPLRFAAILKTILETGATPGFNPVSARQYADESEPQRFVNSLLA